MQKPHNFVLDVNIFISYIITGRLHELVVYTLENDITIYVCPQLLKELDKVINYPKLCRYLKRPASDYTEIIKELITPVTLTQIHKGAPDPEDDYLFALAIKTNSTLVTGDNALVKWQKPPVPVITWASFKKLYR